MSPLRVRVLATALAVAAFAAAVANAFLVQPLSWRAGPGPAGFAIGAAGLVATLLGPPLLLLALTRSARHPPAMFTRREDGTAFTVMPSARITGLAGVGTLVLAGIVLPTAPVPGTGAVRLPTMSAFVALNAGLTVALALLGLTYCWLVRPRLILTPAGITVMGLGLSRTVAWAQLMPGGPPIPHRLAQTLTLGYHETDGRSKPLHLPLGFLHVDRVFLATVLRHYTERPECRSDIGTPAEQTRLEAAFAGR